MKSLTKKISSILLTSILLLGLCWVLEPDGGGLLPRIYEQHSFNNIQSQIHKNESKVKALFEEAESSDSFSEWIPDKFNKLKANNILAFAYKNDTLVYWNNAVVKPSTSIHKNLTLKRLSNGFYLQQDQMVKGYRLTTLIPVKKQYPTENEYLQNAWQISGTAKTNLKLNEPSKAEGYDIYNLNNEVLFTLTGKINLPVPLKNSLAVLAFIGYFFLIGFFHVNTALIFKTGYQLKGMLSLAVSTFIIVIIWQMFNFPAILHSSDLFSSRIYAVSDWLASVGDLIVLVFLVCWWIYFLANYIRWGFPVKRSGQIITAFLYAIPIFLISWGLEELIKSLVLHSSIILNPTRIFDLTFFSFLAYLIIFAYLLGSFIISYYLFRQFYFFQLISNFEKFAIVITILIFNIFAYNYFTGSAGWIFTFSLAKWLIFLGYHSEQQRRAHYFRYIILSVFIVSLFISWRVVYHENEKMHENNRLLASRLMDDGDAIFEYTFDQQFQKLYDDPFLQSYFMNPMIPKEIVAKRVRELYFSGQTNKYDLRIHTYSSSGARYKSPGSPLWDEIQFRIQNAEEVLDGRLYYQASGQSPGYLAIISPQTVNWNGNNVVLEFVRKTYFEESIYPELLLGKGASLERQNRDLSYAIFVNGKLFSQTGNYAYPKIMPEEWYEKTKPHPVDRGGHSHFVYEIDDRTRIIITMPERGVFYQTAAFSSVFIIISVFVILSGVMRFMNLNRAFRIKSFLGRIHPRRMSPLTNIRFGAKVQITIICAVLASLVVTGFVTTRYIMYDFNKRERQDLQEKTRQVLARLEAETDWSGGMRSNETERLIHQMANIYRVDVNLYDPYGDLLFSSQPEIFNQGIISGKMNHHAFFTLSGDGTSHIVQDEQIGELTFIASYFPVEDVRTGEVKGYLSLPYFGKETELEQQISTLLATLVNLYLFMFLLTGVASYIISNAVTKPFKLISNKLRKVKLGESNEPIKWESKDEIGELIREYNHMIRQLEKSADKLAENERELAWREMARQIAHEIKNPLTPMKLNIQRLQIQYSQNSENLDEQFNKTTALLIRQIETLARIASEFSSFARMPAGQPELLDLNKVASESLELYQNNSNVKLKFTPFDKPLTISADSEQLERVITNLITNATDALTDQNNGEIRVYLQNSKNKVKLIIEDNGPGIPPELQNKIFTPNFSTKSRGMGLGLSICRKIIEQAGGEIFLDSSYVKGARFVLSFPQE